LVGLSNILVSLSTLKPEWTHDRIIDTRSWSISFVLG